MLTYRKRCGIINTVRTDKEFEMAERRTRLAIVLDRARFNGITGFYAENRNKPFVSIKGVSFQFRTRKSCADFIDAVDSILTYKKYNFVPTAYCRENAKMAAKNIILIDKEI